MTLKLQNEWEDKAETYSYKAVDGLQNSNWSIGAVREAIYAAYLSGALKATEECSRIMRK